MQRREFLKGLAVLPVAGALGGCRRHHSTSGGAGVSADYHTLQIGIEGAFALVIQKNQGNRIKAFVPRSSDPALQHQVFFNSARPLEKENSFHFELAQDGVKAPADGPYVNPGFSDFYAQTEKWILGDNIITLDLPCPDSINFSMRPQPVIFASGAPGLMPTSHLLEYRLEDSRKLKFNCSRSDEDLCQPLPHCPPGVARFFFGVAPRNHHPFDGRPFDDTHAVKFFNFMLETRFPDLVAKYKLLHIGPQYVRPGNDGGARPVPSVLGSADAVPHLRLVTGTIDCQLGGLLVGTSSASG